MSAHKYTGKIISRDETGMKFVSVPIILGIFVMIIMMLVFFVGGILDFIASDFKSGVTKFAVALVLLIVGLLADNLNWHSDVKYTVYDNGKKIKYYYCLNKAIIPTYPEVEISFQRVDSFKVINRHKNILVKGDIIRRMPLSPPLRASKIKLINVLDHEAEILDVFEKMVQN